MSTDSTMKGRLCSFLTSCRATSGSTYTHTTKPTSDNHNLWVPGTYYIPADVRGAFWDVYNQSVAGGVISTLSEKPGAVFPLHVDLDFKYSLDKGTHNRIWTSTMLKAIVSLHQEAIQQIVDPDMFDEDMMICIMLQKPQPRSEDGFIKDGLHLHFPFFICDAWTQDQLIRGMVLRRMLETNVLDSKRTGLDAMKCLDSDIGRKPWLLYGSYNYKNTKSRPYLYNRWDAIAVSQQYGHVYDSHLNEIPMSRVFQQEMVGRDQDIQYYMPELLSILGHSDATPLGASFAKQRHAELEKRKTRKTKIPQRRKDHAILEDLKLIEDAGFMAMLSVDRAQQHDSKMEVGWCLFCITEGKQEGLDLWKAFCQQADDYDEIKCEDRWFKMTARGMTLGTLRHWARCDSPDLYNEWRQTDVGNQMMDVICEPQITEGAMARVAIALYKDRFLCSDIKNELWYEYYGHRWRPLEAAHEVYNTLNDDLRQLFLVHRKRFHDRIGQLQYQLGEMAPEDQKGKEGKTLKIEIAQQEVYRKGCTNSMQFLNKRMALANTIRMMANRLLDPKFESRKDRNKYLLGFENGILDLQQKRFRNGTPDDKVTMSTGYDYRDIVTCAEAEQFIDDFYAKIYPNSNRRRYKQGVDAQTMEGGNKFKNFYILTGPKDSGKSKSILFMEKLFGTGEDGYAGAFPPQSFTNATNQKTAGGASPEEVRLINKRLAIANEVVGSLNRAFVKLWTSGGDSSYKRGMYDRKGTDNAALVTIYIQANDLPKMPGDDEASFDRVKIVDHESKFVLPDKLDAFPVPETEAERIEMKRWNADPLMDENLEEFKPYFASYLLRIYIKNKGKLDVPDEVKVSNEHYLHENDLYKQFIEDSLEPCANEDDLSLYVIKVKTLFTDFQEWYRQYYKVRKSEELDLRTFTKEMSKPTRLGLLQKGRLTGYDVIKRNFIGWRMRLDDRQDVPEGRGPSAWNG